MPIGNELGLKGFAALKAYALLIIFFFFEFSIIHINLLTYKS